MPHVCTFAQATQALDSEAIDISADAAANAGSPYGVGTYRVTDQGLDSVVSVRQCGDGTSLFSRYVVDMFAIDHCAGTFRDKVWSVKGKSGG